MQTFEQFMEDNGVNLPSYWKPATNMPEKQIPDLKQRQILADKFRNLIIQRGEIERRHWWKDEPQTVQKHREISTEIERVRTQMRLLDPNIPRELA